MTSNIQRKLNLTFVDQLSYLSGLHRSGWPFVMDQLKQLQKKDGDDDGIWCDTYVDRTFHWAASTLVPYSRPWIGFIHHTFDTVHSDYNNVNLLKNTDFLESLVKCKGLFVFSSAQKTRWERELALRGFFVPVSALVHPTESVPTDKEFTPEKFYTNSNKKIVSVGAWLRDTYAIYELNGGKSPLSVKGTEAGTTIAVTKAALQGPRMQGYFKPLNFFRIFTQPGWRNFDFRPPAFTAAPHLENSTSSNTSQQRVTSVNGELPDGLIDIVKDTPQDDGICRDTMCRDVMCRDSAYTLNKYVAGAVNHLRKVDDSVTILPTASNAEYDDLLTENIVFLKLIDAAAVNTVLECLVRNTPILVNRDATSVVELLGADYPLFYDNLDDLKVLLTLDSIKAAYNYLKSLDKDIVTGAHFIKAFVSSAVYQSL